MKTILILILAAGSASAMADVTGFQQYSYQSPSGVHETCVLHRMPGVNYRKNDPEKEQEFCSVDLYSGAYAICSKTWSTSPGSVIYDIRESGMTVQQVEDQCRAVAEDNDDDRVEDFPGVDKVAKFKNTMNSSGTSGTYSQSSLVYYHFSRFFETITDVPVAVYRTIDREQHLNRVSLRAEDQGRMGRQMRAGWEKMISSEQNPESYSPTNELFTDDLQKIYGIMIRGKGERYGPEFNGVRSKWGLQQNVEFTETAPFRALSSQKPLAEAISEGLETARKTRKLRDALGDQVSDVQMIFWMTNLAEITLMDYIFSQQDRVGNVDFRWYWVYVKDDDLKDKRENDLEDDKGDELHRYEVDIANVQPPKKIAEYNPVLIQKTQLNDNDAAVRKLNTKTDSPYVNYTKKAKMLEKIRRYPASLYSKLVQLNQDFEGNGIITQWTSTQFNINPQYIDSAKYFARQALDILKAKCEKGELIFDLDPKEFLQTGTTQPKQMDCHTGVYQ